MGEEQVKVTIEKDGSIQVKTHGLKGDDCLDALEELLAELVDSIDAVELTKEHKEAPAGQRSKRGTKDRSKTTLGSGKR